MKNKPLSKGVSFDVELKNVWNENDLERKKQLAIDICRKFKFKNKQAQIEQELIAAQTTALVDKLITNACLSGEGLKVLKT